MRLKYLTIDVVHQLFKTHNKFNYYSRIQNLNVPSFESFTTRSDIKKTTIRKNNENEEVGKKMWQKKNTQIVTYLQ